MKKIPLTQDKHALVDDEDFEYLNKFKWHYQKTKNGTSGYAVRKLRLTSGKQASVYMHRVVNNTSNELETDHKNNNRLDNRKVNLRIATTRENQRNRLVSTKGTSPYKGVSWCKQNNKWRADIKTESGSIYLGLFVCELAAVTIYNHAAIKYFGDFAKPNLLYGENYVNRP